jgi:hypothetical protein
VTQSVFQRTIWDGVSREEATWWTLHKGERVAVCRMFTHQLGHEMRLEVANELVASQVCREDDHILSWQERWRVGLEEKGWAAAVQTSARTNITSQ